MGMEWSRRHDRARRKRVRCVNARVGRAECVGLHQSFVLHLCLYSEPMIYNISVSFSYFKKLNNSPSERQNSRRQSQLKAEIHSNSVEGVRCKTLALGFNNEEIEIQNASPLGPLGPGKRSEKAVE
jgi:hypothetical protein